MSNMFSPFLWHVQNVSSFVTCTCLPTLDAQRKGKWIKEDGLTEGSYMLVEYTLICSAGCFTVEKEVTQHDGSGDELCASQR